MATGPTTRAAAQQQKLEEHLAVILQRLDMQKADLDQSSADQDSVPGEASPTTASTADRGRWTEG